MAKSKKIDKDMGFRLKKARLDQKLTYDELSEKSGVSSRKRGLIICPFCETFNSQKNTRCCACGQPIRK